MRSICRGLTAQSDAYRVRRAGIEDLQRQLGTVPRAPYRRDSFAQRMEALLGRSAGGMEPLPEDALPLIGSDRIASHPI